MLNGNAETTKMGKSHPALGLFGCLFVYLHVCELAICRFISQDCTTLTLKHVMTLPTVDLLTV